MSTRLSISLIIFTFLASCSIETKQEVLESNIVGIPADTLYYTSEIIKLRYNDLYSSWKLDKIRSGWGITTPYFDTLKIKPYGKFEVIRNDSILAFGRLDIEEQNDSILTVKFITDLDTNRLILGIPNKQIILTDSNTLELYAPCCDFDNFYLSRENRTSR
jgi:hypothetical protein